MAHEDTRILPFRLPFRDPLGPTPRRANQALGLGDRLLGLDRARRRLIRVIGAGSLRAGLSVLLDGATVKITVLSITASPAPTGVAASTDPEPNTSSEDAQPCPQ